MIFLNEHSPSIPAKVLMSLGVLAGTLTATALTTGYSDWLVTVLSFEKVEGNIYRQIVMFICCFVYFLRFSMGLFVFMQRKISWFEGGLVTVLFFMMFVYFIAFEIPRLDKHLGKKYGKEFTEYSQVTKRFVPFVY